MIVAKSHGSPWLFKVVCVFNKNGHIALGFSGGFIAVGFNHMGIMEFYPHYIFFIFIGSLLPDIDHPNSTFGRYNPFTRFMKHRGKCHTIIGCTLLAIPFILISLPAFWCVLFGAYLHLLGDKAYSLTSPKRRRYSIKFW